MSIRESQKKEHNLSRPNVESAILLDIWQLKVQWW